MWLSMQREVDYFSNHRLKLRFPWRLYHAPIVAALQRVLRLCPGRDVLNIGSGPFFELDSLDAGKRQFTVCDIDPRAVALARERYGARLAGADVIEPEKRLPYADHSFDVVVSMDVIEHVPEPLPWVQEALRVLLAERSLVPDDSGTTAPRSAAADRKYCARGDRSAAAFQPKTPTPDQNGRSAPARCVLALGWCRSATIERIAVRLGAGGVREESLMAQSVFSTQYDAPGSEQRAARSAVGADAEAPLGGDGALIVALDLQRAFEPRSLRSSSAGGGCCSRTC